MKQAIDTTIRDAAIQYAKLVLPHAKEIGLDVESMKERMAKWVTVVENYDRDIRAAWSNPEMSYLDKADLVRKMMRTRNSIREELFGEGEDVWRRK